MSKSLMDNGRYTRPFLLLTGAVARLASKRQLPSEAVRKLEFLSDFCCKSKIQNWSICQPIW